MKILLTLFFSVIVYHFSSAQIYEKIYAESSIEVQNKLNQNKVNGIDILTDVIAIHHFGIIGLNLASIREFEKILRNEKSVEIISISEDLTNIKISSNARFNKQNIETLFSNLSMKIVSYEVNYKIK
ncbi:MAG: hypothetical protein EBZ95_13695 [Chitinophagia bacterium]|nr:hypothetical protein [Chitinophagia bacterium]